MNLRDKKMKSILEKGSGFSRMELRRVDAEGRSPLIHAVLRGNKNQVVAMIDAGAEIDATDYNGDTALAHANRAGYSAIGRLLVSKGADPSHKNFAGVEAGTPPSDTKDEARSDASDDTSQPLTLKDGKSLIEPVTAEATERMRPTISQQTQDLIDAIEAEKYDWDQLPFSSIDIPRIVHYILNSDSNVEVSLYGDALLTWVHLLTAIAEIDPRWMHAVLSKINPDMIMPDWVGEDTEPRVLWNGDVLIRKDGEVLGLSYSETTCYDAETRKAILDELEQRGKIDTIISEYDGLIQYTSDTEKINFNGNNIVVVDNDTDEESDGSVVVLRFFHNGMHQYELVPFDDRLDFVMDSTTLAPVEADGDKVPIGELAAQALSPKSNLTSGVSTHGPYNLVRPDEEREKPLRILHDYLKDYFLDGRACDEGLPEESRLNATGVLEALSERLCTVMGEEIQRMVLWMPDIFASAPDRIRGYEGSYPATMVASVDRHILIEFTLDQEVDEESEIDLAPLGDTEWIKQVLLEAEPRATDVVFEINIPESSDIWGPWTTVDETSLAFLTERLRRIENDEDGFLPEIINGRVLRCRFTLPNLSQINLKQFGAEFGEGLADMIEGGNSILSQSFSILVPSMGIHQSFFGSDSDSGNL